MKRILIASAIVMIFALTVFMLASCSEKASFDPFRNDKGADQSTTFPSSATELPDETEKKPENTEKAPDDTTEVPKTDPVTEPITEPATEPVTEPAVDTTEDVTTNTEAPEVLPAEVVTAYEYEKPVIPTDQSIELGWTGEGFSHSIKIPAITSKTNNSAAFNKKISGIFDDTLSMLQNNEEGYLIINVSYDYKVYNGLIAIIITYSEGAQVGGVGVSYAGFYYDTVNDCEISFDEYLEKVGISRDGVIEKMWGIDSFLSMVNEAIDMGENVTVASDDLICCAFDKEGTIVVIRYDYSMNETLRFDFEPMV